jgi:zinc transporter, ZIP family
MRQKAFFVALFLINQKISKIMAFLLATLTAAIEIVTSLIGYYLTSFIQGLVPYGLSFAAGAMLFIFIRS